MHNVKVLIILIGKYTNTNIEEKQGNVFWGDGQKGPKKEACKPNCEVWEGTARLQMKEKFSKNENKSSSLWGQRFSWMFEELNWSLSSVSVAGKERVKHLPDADRQVTHCGLWTSTSYFLEHCHWFYTSESSISHGKPFELGVAVLVLEVCEQKPVESHTFNKWREHSKPLFESNNAFTLEGPTQC